MKASVQNINHDHDHNYEEYNTSQIAHIHKDIPPPPHDSDHQARSYGPADHVLFE